MPVGSTKAPPRQIVFLFVATILGFVAMYFLFTRTADLAQSGDVQISIGDDVFAPGNVDRLSEELDLNAAEREAEAEAEASEESEEGEG